MPDFYSRASPNAMQIGRSYPITAFSFQELAQFFHRIQQKIPGFALLKDNDWEYAARAGSTYIWPWGHRKQDARQYAHWAGDHPEVQPKGLCTVKSLSPNFWGLYDVMGNAVELCLWDQDPAAIWSTTPRTSNLQSLIGYLKIKGGSIVTIYDRSSYLQYSMPASPDYVHPLIGLRLFWYK